MPLAFYKPNKTNRGFCCSFNYSSKDNVVYAQLLRQVSWDETNKIGKFKDDSNNPDNKVSIKLGEVELAGIIDSIETNRGETGFSVFHKTETGPNKSINFKPYLREGTQIGFSFNITQTDKQDSTKKLSWYIGFNYAEGVLVREYLKWCLFMIFSNQSNPLDYQVAKQSFVNKSPEKVSNNTEEQIL